ncbi:MAG: glycosyl transferase [Firmicutes bacterium]|nr:glycosyl transferase [Bacillota bacterium]
MHLMLFVTKTLWLLSFFMILYAGYYACTSVFALKKLKAIPEAKPKNRFAAIIAARNEENVIGNLVKSLREQNYPAELIEVFVIPNNCTDNTRGAALMAGAVVVDCDREVKSKGDVLNFAFDKIFKGREDFDAYCVFDADNLADPDFFREMNNALSSGMKAAQGFRDSKNPNDSAVSAWYSIYYLTLNRILNHSRSVLGMSSWVNGTGFMISDEAIRELGGWNTKTISEDMEITTLCVLKGINIGWVPKAVVYDEQPITFAQSWSQRRRWSTGMQDCAMYIRPLLVSAVRKKNINCIEVVFTIIAPYVQLLGCIAFMMTMFLTGIKIKYDLFPDTFLFVRLFLSLDSSYISTTAVAALAVWLGGKSVRKLSYGILSFWIFLATWVPINIISLFWKQKQWSKIEHTRQLTLRDIVDQE